MNAAPPQRLPLDDDSPISAGLEARAFWRMRGRLLVNTLRLAFGGSRLRLMVLAVVSLLFWALLFWLFLDAFHFLTISIPNPASRLETVRVIFGLFFVTLLVMLLFSSGLILYGLLFRAREPSFLLTLPVRPERVFVHKFQEALVISSWGFVLLGSPMLIAYGLAAEAPWHYFLMLAPFALAFICIPCALGGVLCLAIVHWAPKARLKILGLLAVLVLVYGAWHIWSTLSGPRSNALTPSWFREMIVRLHASEHRLLPSWWFSTGLLESSMHGSDQLVHLREGLLFLSVLITNALLAFLLASIVSGRLYRPAYNRLFSSASNRRARSVGWLDRAASTAILPLPRPMRTLLIKDLRLFRRDPMQWLQFLVFFGLLSLYFINMRPVVNNIGFTAWANLIGFLNVGVVGLILSTFTSRFIFPMISLESSRFWILGRLPIRRDTILWSKFVFAFLWSIFPSVILVGTSDLMLQIEPWLVGLHIGMCVLLCSGLSAIAVGLGARLPHPRADSPSKVAAGFGGTLTLVISAAYILLLVLVVALPCHFYLQPLAGSNSVLAVWVGRWFNLGTGLSVAKGAFAGLIIGIAATVLPMVVGFRAFRQMEG